MRLAALAIQAQEIKLEAVLSTPEGHSGPLPAVVLCNPHPLLSGNMEHPLLQAISRALDQMGLATLRFNYRGVGASEGEFTNGQQEAKDILAALRLVRAWPGIDRGRIAILGYSFGAAVLLRCAEALKGVRTLVFISPPPSALARSRALRYGCPKLFLVGQADRIAPAERLQELLLRVSTATLEVVASAAHSWRGFEGEAADHAARFLAHTLLE